LTQGAQQKGKKTKNKPQSLLVLLSENSLLKIALKLKSIIAWKLKSHQIFHWKTEGAAALGEREGASSQGAGQACPAEQASLFWMLLKLAPVAETLALIGASRSGDKCGAGETTGKRSTWGDRKGKGLLCSRNPCLPHPS